MDRAEAIESLIDYVEKGEPILVLDVEGVPTIHNFYPRKYFKSIDHLGFGFFQGETEHGKFNFDAGGAMHDWRWDDGKEPKWIAWSPLRVDNPEVLKDLGYDIETVKVALFKAKKAMEAIES